MSTLTTPSSCSSFLRLKKKPAFECIRMHSSNAFFKHSNAFECIRMFFAIFHSSWQSSFEWNPFETRNAFKYGSQKPRNGIRTFEWKMADHSNAFECLFLGPVESFTGPTNGHSNAIPLEECLGIPRGECLAVPFQGLESVPRMHSS